MTEPRPVPVERFLLRAVGRTDVGAQRTQNEDAMYYDDFLGVSDAVVVRVPADDVELVVQRRWAAIGRLHGHDVGGFTIDWYRRVENGWAKQSSTSDSRGRFAI